MSDQTILCYPCGWSLGSLHVNYLLANETHDSIVCAQRILNKTCGQGNCMYVLVLNCSMIMNHVGKLKYFPFFFSQDLDWFFTIGESACCFWVMFIERLQDVGTEVIKSMCSPCTEYLGPVPNTHTLAWDCQLLPFQKIWHSILTPQAPACMQAHKLRQAHAHTY